MVQVDAPNVAVDAVVAPTVDAMALAPGAVDDPPALAEGQARTATRTPDAHAPVSLDGPFAPLTDASPAPGVGPRTNGAAFPLPSSAPAAAALVTPTARLSDGARRGPR